MRPGASAPVALAWPLPEEVARCIEARGNKPRVGDNIGLWLDKLVQRDRRTGALEKGGRERAFRVFCDRWKCPAAQHALERRREGLKTTKALFKVFTARLDSPLMVDHGRAVATEVSLSFHPIYGTPRIPGTALKGATRAWLEAEGAIESVPWLFGDTANEGHLVMHEALPVDGAFALALDVLTPHHKDYYEGREPPADWLSPEPHTFLTVVETTFEFCVEVETRAKDDEARCEREHDRAVEALQNALEVNGVGGKTSSGYGRFRDFNEVRP